MYPPRISPKDSWYGCVIVAAICMNKMKARSETRCISRKNLAFILFFLGYVLCWLIRGKGIRPVPVLTTSAFLYLGNSVEFRQPFLLRKIEFLKNFSSASFQNFPGEVLTNFFSLIKGTASFSRHYPFTFYISH